MEYLIPATKGFALEMKRGQSIRVTDVDGEQVADFVAFQKDDYLERLDPSVTMDVLRAYRVGKGDILYSNKYRPMFTIVEDSVQCHDLLNSSCRPEMYKVLYKKPDHSSCYENLSIALTLFGVPIPDQHYPINLFMHTDVTPDGKMVVKRPKSRPGDCVVLKAEIDVVVGVSACPCEESVVNGYRCTPIRIEIQ